jgi:tetratricopeptide (TPR) repeat protein
MLLKRLFGFFGKSKSNAQAEMQSANELFEAGNFAEASRLYTALTARVPTPESWVNLGYCRMMLADSAGAIDAFAKAIALRPGFAPALVGLGDVAARLNNHVLALHNYDQALASDPSLPVTHNNRAQSLFALGRTIEAWQEAERRFETPDAKNLYPHRYELPRWTGAPIFGRLLVHWEQGYGDMLQHLRFLPLLEARGVDYVFECPPPLWALVARTVGRSRVVLATNQPADVQGFGAICGLLSLPYLLSADPDALPQPPYLITKAGQSENLRKKWLADVEASTRLIGVAWHGSDFDRSRNAALADFSKLAGPGIRLVSLQKEVSPAEATLLAELGAVNVGAYLTDFAATAHVIGALDVVVSTDTAVAHLAGALARPVWLLLSEPAAVRWMLDRADTPWYPSARLLRKPGSAPWVTILEQVRQQLVVPEEAISALG